MRPSLVLLLLICGACREAVAPMAGERFVLRAIDGRPLPATQPGLAMQVLADTLTFGIESSQWRPRPLARATRRVRYLDGRVATEEWWYTCDAQAGIPFPFRGLCADGDLARVAAPAAACIDASGTATIADNELVIRFRILGTLRYERVQQ